MTVEELQIKWANQRYGRSSPVTRVSFDVENGMEGCPTCGPEPAYIEVCVSYADGEYRIYEQTFTSDLMNDILSFALEQDV